jgi:hypothetical protein
MPRRRVPSYRFHKPSGQAVVTLCGKDFYLGRWQSEASRAEYDRRITEWLANGRRVAEAVLPREITMTELLAAYWKFAQTYYVKNGKPTVQQAHIKVVLTMLRQTYGHIFAKDFGPLALKALQQQ